MLPGNPLQRSQAHRHLLAVRASTADKNCRFPLRGTRRSILEWLVKVTFRKITKLFILKSDRVAVVRVLEPSELSETNQDLFLP